MCSYDLVKSFVNKVFCILFYFDVVLVNVVICIMKFVFDEGNEWFFIVNVVF